jgi:hypothetical protein
VELLSPLSLAWLGLLGPLVALYILKRRRIEREVGSTLLWELALRDLRAERPFKRLIPHLSLLLQILIVILGAIALSRPAGAGRIPNAARLAVVIDTSASMAATDAEGKSRLERAQEAARDLARALPAQSEMMVIEARGEPVVISPLTDDATALERAIDALDVRGGPSDLEAAVALAVERVRGSPSTRVVLLTDAATDGEIELDRRTTEVEVRQVGEPAANSGIVALDVRPRPSAEAPDRADVFVRVARFGEGDADLFVNASIEGRGVVASRRVRVASGETEALVLTADLPPDASGKAAIVRVELAREGEDGTGDAFALDDVAVAPSPGARRLPVFVVGTASPSIERVFRSDESVELFATTLERLATREDPDAPLDGLVVYAGPTPGTAPPGDSVVVAPSGDRAFEATFGEDRARPTITTWDEEDPRLRFVTLSDVNVASLRSLAQPAGRTLVSTDRGPAILSIERPDGETTLLAFDPEQSDWPDKASFVVFFRNLLERARGRRAAGGIAPGSLGEPLRVAAPDGVEVDVSTPSGASLSARSRGGVAVVPVPAEPGVYLARVGGRELAALRSLLDPAESDLAPRARFTRGGSGTTTGVAKAEDHVESWPWFIGALLLVLLLEAIWATRRNAT